MLLNPTYAALLAPAQPSGEHDAARIDLSQCTPGAWPAIVTRDQLVAARGRLVGVQPMHHGTARRWLLSGLAVCSVCHQPVRSARGETHPTARVDGSGTAPSQRYHAYRCTRGHLMRNGDIIDELVAEVVIARLSRPDAAIAGMVASGRLSPQAAEQALDDLAAEIRELDARLARAILSDPLAELVGVADVRAWWEGASLARRRAIVDTLMTVEIQPVGYGRRVTTLEQALETVTLTPKR